MHPLVLDTNVLIAAAFRPGSESGAVVAGVRAGRWRLVWDEPTRRETEALFRKIPPISWTAVEDLYREQDRFEGAVDPEAFGAVQDPEDLKLAALAAAAAAILVSLDAHLLDAGLGGSPEVVRPGAVIERLGGP